ncbi:calcium homeostasis endoplasmic reticulum protein [Frankliniella occidentalis]|uniref:Calcium homeostasis endoplasmic reticulum protein n=1 Tax=Frankliniella occidentalis TaxID=133901 RepID=A0A6J1S172_FRAOC|nr:calcium homeostasis endoplasmic reticulum protein [Frankliniella occidentalis]
MELPQPPQDIDLRNIIDKLAQFVARNGMEFEQMTKNKQKDNPKFSFLFGGEHFNYYQYKVTTEQAIFKQKSKHHHLSAVSNLSDLTGHQLSNISSTNSASMDLSAAVSAAQWLAAQQQQHQSSVPAAPAAIPSVSSSTSASLDSIAQQKRVLQEQIQQSEQNLAAQHAVLMQQQEQHVEEALRKAQKARLEQLGVDAGVPFAEFDQILAPIIQSCTKDSISTGKGWILQKAISPAANAALAQFLLAKIINVGKESNGPQPTASPFSQRLHIIYLVNDVLHHCVRKNADMLKNALESVVVPMFCCTSVGLPEDQQAKLNKLLNLWESKNNYLDENTIEKLKNPSKSWAEYQAGLIEQFSSIISAITSATKNTYDNYQSQHQAFVSHALQQIQTLEQQQALAVVNAVMPPTQPLPSQPDMHQQRDQQPPLIGALPTQPTSTAVTQPPPLLSNLEYSNPQAPLSLNQLPTPHQPPQGPPPSTFTQPPPGFFPGNFPPGVELPDFSRPPPGFPLPPPTIPPLQPPPEPIDDLVPSVPYFDLPAGLMVPLIKLDDFEYKPLDPDAIRLPPPAPPSERLLTAVEAFYAPPGHDRPRDSGLSVSRRIVDSEGWEKLGLYEYYRAKNQARKRREDDVLAGIRERSRSPSPILRPPSREKSPLPKKRYRSVSPENDKTKEKSKEKGRSRSPSRSPIRSSTNELSSGASNGRRSPISAMRRQTKASFRRSRSRSRSQSRSCSRSRSRSSSRSRSRSPPKHSLERERSPTPPSFLGSTYAKTATERLDESNKGHQMLKKMGWGGAGLGAKEQGIEQPISGGEIRDRNDMYKGVGVNLNDPYENFRKNKGQAFISRMKARAEERI